MPSKLKTQPTEKPLLLTVVFDTILNLLLMPVVKTPAHKLTIPRMIAETIVRLVFLILAIWYLYIVIKYGIIPRLG